MHLANLMHPSFVAYDNKTRQSMPMSLHRPRLTASKKHHDFPRKPHPNLDFSRGCFYTPPTPCILEGEFSHRVIVHCVLCIIHYALKKVFNSQLIVLPLHIISI